MVDAGGRRTVRHLTDLTVTEGRGFFGGSFATVIDVVPGPATVSSDLNVGPGPPPAPADLGDACDTPVAVPPATTVVVSLDWLTGCVAVR